MGYVNFRAVLTKEFGDVSKGAQRINIDLNRLYALTRKTVWESDTSPTYFTEDEVRRIKEALGDRDDWGKVFKYV